MRRFIPLLLLLLPLVFGAWTPFRAGESWVNGSWYCRAISATTYHCTQHWHRVGRYVVSDNPAWVPNGSVQAVRSTVQAVNHSAPTGHSPNTYPYGQCTWGAAHLSHDNVNHLGNAENWLANARARGLPTGSSPRVGATVVYQPFVQGASSLGHVAHVVRVLSNGGFVVEEMNYYGFGGGWGKWSYRTSHTGWGVGFIY